MLFSFPSSLVFILNFNWFSFIFFSIFFPIFFPSHLPVECFIEKRPFKSDTRISLKKLNFFVKSLLIKWFSCSFSTNEQSKLQPVFLLPSDAAGIVCRYAGGAFWKKEEEKSKERLIFPSFWCGWTEAASRVEDRASVLNLLGGDISQSIW